VCEVRISFLSVRLILGQILCNATVDRIVVKDGRAVGVTLADGSVIEVSRDNEHRDLFGLVLGGYGLFGVLFDATMRCDDNSRLALDVLSVSVADFSHVYDSLLAEDDKVVVGGGGGGGGGDGGGAEVVTKLARLDATTLATAEVFIFRRASPAVTVSALPIKPREMSLVSRLLYKWIAGPLREARYALEHEMGVALDWQPVSDRNSMVFESAATLVRLYSPLVSVDDTFILQEFFVPRASFADFVAGARGPLVVELPKESLVTLLNISVRFVRQDVDTALPYARHVGGSFAFVLYYRMRRSAEADAVLRRYHTVLAAVALNLGGTFYLPYRLHYSDAELIEAYPGFSDFCARKSAYDPDGLFGNQWFDRYKVTEVVGTDGKVGEPSGGAAATAALVAPPSMAPKPAATTLAVGRAPALGMPPLLHALRARREGSFRALFRDAEMRSAFLEGFLVDVFSIVPSGQMLRMLAFAVWDARNKSDTDIFVSLQKQIEQRGPPLSKLSGLWAGIKQLSAQRAELVRETVSVLARLGKVGVMHSYCSIGDHGKLVLALREALGMLGRAWIAHDVNAKEDDVPACLERGANDGLEVAEFVAIDYSNLCRGASSAGLLAAIPSGACDLVTLNQGLHHLVPAQIPNLLAAVHRVLRPGGVFLLREHDLDNECRLLPMLDCAHMVFNAVTGVRVEVERQELRCFRPLAHWREIVAQAGFEDAQVYELQPHDPTVDVMLSFTKPFESAGPEAAAPFPASARSPQARGAAVAAQLVMNSLPGLAIEGATSALETVLQALPRLRAQLHALVVEQPQPASADTAATLPPAVRAAAALFVEKYLDPSIMMLARLRPLAAVALPVSESRKDLLLPSEIFLLEATVRRRAAEGGKVESAIVALFERISAMTQEVKAPQAAASAAASASASAAAAATAAAPSAEADALALIEQLIAAIPALSDPDALLGSVGLSPKAEGIARALLASAVEKGGSDKAAAARALARTLDERGRAELLGALPSLLAERKPPHMQLLLQKHSPWRAAALALLGCPAVENPSHTQAFFAQGVGLGPLLLLQKEAKARRRVQAPAAGAGADARVGTGAGAGAGVDARASAGTGPGSSSASGAGEDACTNSAAINSALLTISPIVEYEGDRHDIGNVLRVVSARLEIRSGTGLFAPVVTDVTEQARALLDPSTGLLALSRLEAPAVLRLGKRVVSVRYRALPGVAPPGGRARIGELCRALAAAGVLDGAARAGNTANNFFKLPEWLQVEVSQAFADSMEITPWFREAEAVETPALALDCARSRSLTIFSHSPAHTICLRTILMRPRLPLWPRAAPVFLCLCAGGARRRAAPGLCRSARKRGLCDGPAAGHRHDRHVRAARASSVAAAARSR